MSDTPLRRHVTLVLEIDADGYPTEINRAWSEDEVRLPTGGLGKTPAVNVTEGTLAGFLPEVAATLAQLVATQDALKAANIERDEAVKAKADAEERAAQLVERAAKDAAEAVSAAEADKASTIAAAEADRDAKVAAAEADRDAVAGRVSELEARVAELTAPPTAIVVSDRQFFQALALGDMITRDEAEAAVATGTIPERMLTLVGMLPEDQQFGARMLLKGATTFSSDHALSSMLAQLFGLTEDQKMDVFRVASSL